MVESAAMAQYFANLDAELARAYAVATAARARGFDPERKVDIPVAKDMAERVAGLISAVSDKLTGTGMAARIHELEEEHGILSWKVALLIAEEVAKEKFCKFTDIREAVEMGIRVGFAYHTLGIVAAPLEGFIDLKIKKRRDGKEYVAACYAGPIRGAGGTAAAFSVIITDYVRTKMGFAPYDPTEEEINHLVTEIGDYHERVTNLQYFPSEEELRFIIQHLTVEVSGDPTEKLEVSNHKDAGRIETNMIRGGVCLVLAEGIAQKARKLWVQLRDWGEAFSLNWQFLDEFLTLQKAIKAKHTPSAGEKPKITPNYTYINDIVAGRPVLTSPMAAGGLRLRYGRTRNSGFSSAAVHPATLAILNRYFAAGTQLKVERPGKATALTVCDSIDGPIVKLTNGSVLQLQSEPLAKKLLPEIQEILFLGDILYSYGDFSVNGHPLVPVGYCAEWWHLELRKAITTANLPLDPDVVAAHTGLSAAILAPLLTNPFAEAPDFSTAYQLSKVFAIPLHPMYVPYWSCCANDQFLPLLDWLLSGTIERDGKQVRKIILPIRDIPKRTLELIGLPHTVATNEYAVIEGSQAEAVYHTLGLHLRTLAETREIAAAHVGKPVLEIINQLTDMRIRDRAGTFIGSRMGRPEKAKMRELTGRPQVLFPVGEQGGVMRSFQEALSVGKVIAQFPFLHCPNCNAPTIYRHCDQCGSVPVQKYSCRHCGELSQPKCAHGPALTYREQEIDLKRYFNQALKILGTTIYPDLVKGVSGTSNKDHIPEHLAKGILRAKYNLAVNKDGTTRYDMTELPITHFRPSEIRTSVERLRELGYTHDCKGNPLHSPDQVLELKPQDLILSSSIEALEETADKVLYHVAGFADELLATLYGSTPYYQLTKPSDLIGHLVVGLAPHISTGIVGRIIGFSDTQALLAHPLFHAAMRRDCFSADTYIPLQINGRWQLRKIGELVERLNPQEVIDDFGTREIKVTHTNTLGANGRVVPVYNFTKHTTQPMIELRTKLGRVLKTTANHKHLVFRNGKPAIVRASGLQVGDTLGIPYRSHIPKHDIRSIDLLAHCADQDWVMVRGINRHFPQVKRYARAHFPKRAYDNYTSRDSYPIAFISKLIAEGVVTNSEELLLAAKRDTVTIPAVLTVTKELLQLIGLYVAEGYSRTVPGRLHQVYIAAQRNEIRQFIRKTMHALFGLSPSERKTDRLTYSSRVLYHLFTSILSCGASAYEKRMPALFLNLPNKKLGYLLSGYLEGDGSVSETDNRVCFDTVSEGLLRDIDFLCAQMGVFVKNYTYTSTPGPAVRAFYERKGRLVPSFTVTKGTIQSVFVRQFARYVDFISQRKKRILRHLLKRKTARRISAAYSSTAMFDTITALEILPPEESYCLNVKENQVIANSILSRQCDGDEACVILLMDALLNFSRQFLPNNRGGRTMDSPLVLTARLVPAEVDDMAHGLDTVWQYPLELYEAAQRFADTKELRIEQIKHRLGKPEQYEGMGYTHEITNLNMGNRCSAYKTIPSMEDKLKGQMELADKIRAVDARFVAELVIEKHFIKDIKGNLRKFSTQKFRCVKCNEKFRRPPLIGKCLRCGGKLLFTVSEGSVVKYLEPSMSLARKYNLSPYLYQTLEITQRRIEGVFGKEKERQAGLGSWFG